MANAAKSDKALKDALYKKAAEHFALAAVWAGKKDASWPKVFAKAALAFIKIIERGHHPDEVVGGESLKDLLWAFYVDEKNYEHAKAQGEANA